MTDEATYTKGRYQTRGDFDIYCLEHVSHNRCNGYRIAYVNYSSSGLVAWMPSRSVAIANARRIVECVNACAGMADPETEIQQLHKLAIAPVAIDEMQAELERETERHKNHDRELAERTRDACLETTSNVLCRKSSTLDIAGVKAVNDCQMALMDLDLDAILKGGTNGEANDV